MATQQSQQPQAPVSKPYVPTKKPETDYPYAEPRKPHLSRTQSANAIPTQLIDSDPHISRVLRYARSSDYAYGTAVAALPPSLMLLWERVSPSGVGKGGFAPIMRLNVALGALAGAIIFYQRSCWRFYGVEENGREIAMDMREMVGRVKRGEPLYGKSALTDYMQGVAARNSRYTGVFMHMIPMVNIVNHEHHGVDTAKYYQQAERELDAERLAKDVDWKSG